MGEGARQKTAGSTEKTLVAIHHDVKGHLANWSRTDHKSTAEKTWNLARALQARNESTVQAILRQLRAESVKSSAESLLELGPKQQKGGAPRVFLSRTRRVAAFVAAGIEKGSSGAREMGTAIDRASGIGDLVRDARTEHDLKTGLKSLGYEVFA